MAGSNVLAIVVVPGVLTVVLRKTSLFWLPGAAMIVAGIYELGSISQVHSDDSVVGVRAGVGDFLSGACFGGYGLVCLIAGVCSYRRARGRRMPRLEPPAVELPPASAVRDLTKT